MVIGICEDDKIWQFKAKKIIAEYADSIALHVEIVIMNGKKSLMLYEGAQIDVLFMDIVLEEDNGIELASLINARWKRCQIVYLTNYIYYATEVYGTNHKFFVLKEQFGERVGVIFEKIFHEQNQKATKLIFTLIGCSELILAPEDILYFERVKRETLIYTVWGKYKTWDKLDNVYEKLSDIDFVRCHNSYIIYFPAVREMYKDSFILRNGVKVSISRSYLKATKDAFMRWALTQSS